MSFWLTCYTFGEYDDDIIGGAENGGPDLSRRMMRVRGMYQVLMPQQASYPTWRFSLKGIAFQSLQWLH